MLRTMPTIASTVTYDQLFCPSLQDTCKLYILATIDEYPVDVLAKLPLHMRRKLFMAMPVIDRVHFEGTAFLAGLEVVEYKDFISSTSNTVFLSSTVDSATIKADLVSALFSQLEEGALAKLCSLNLQDAFGSFDCLNSSSMNDSYTDFIVRLVHQIMYSLHYSKLNEYYISKGYCNMSQNGLPLPSGYSRDDTVQNAVVVASRPFILPPQPVYDGSSPSWRMFYRDHLWLQNYECFAKYCQLASSVPAHLEINPIDFLQSPIWRDYKIARDEAAKQAHAEGISDITAVNPFVCKPTYPYLQELLCTVEHLTLGTNANRVESADYIKYDSYVAVPYILMSAITSNSSLASLKSISVYAIGKRAVLSMSTIAGFLIGSDYFASSSSYYVKLKYDEYVVFSPPVVDFRVNNYYYSLSPPEGDPFLIKSLTFEACDGYLCHGCEHEKITTSVRDSRSVSKVLKAVVSKQMGSIKNMSVLGIGIVSDEMYGSPEERFDSYLDRHDDEAPSEVTAEEYENLLMSSFVEFVKQPQFDSLTLSKSPESCCYQLVTAFLTTPTSHNQTLTLSVKKANSAYNIDLSSLPSGAAFKSLHFKEESDDCKLCRQVVSIPELCLKSIQVPALALTSVSDGVRIDVPHVRINFCKPSKSVSQYEILCHGISLFLYRNISLAALEFNVPDSSSSTIQAYFLPIINAALNSLLSNRDSSQKTLEEIRLKYTNLNSIDELESDEDESSYDERSESSYGGELSDDDDSNSVSDSAESLNNADAPDDESSCDDSSSSSYSTDSCVIPPGFHSSGSTCIDFFLLVHKLGNVSLRLPARTMFCGSYFQEELFPKLQKEFEQNKLPKITVEGMKRRGCRNSATLPQLEQIAQLVQYS